jgi:hypothetical protein
MGSMRQEDADGGGGYLNTHTHTTRMDIDELSSDVPTGVKVVMGNKQSLTSLRRETYRD